MRIENIDITKKVDNSNIHHRFILMVDWHDGRQRRLTKVLCARNHTYLYNENDERSECIGYLYFDVKAHANATTYPTNLLKLLLRYRDYKGPHGEAILRLIDDQKFVHEYFKIFMAKMNYGTKVSMGVDFCVKCLENYPSFSY